MEVSQMEMPLFDPRSKEQILQYILAQAANYVPEWEPTAEQDSGWILSRMIAEQFYDSLKRFHQVPYKNMLYFLNLLGADTLPCSASQGFATVVLNEGTPSGVPIPSGSRIFGVNEQNRVLFETTESFLAVDNAIEAIYAQNANETILIQCYTAEQKQGFRMFDFANLPNCMHHRLLFRPGTIIYANANAIFTVSFENVHRRGMEQSVAAYLAQPQYANWWLLVGEEQYPLQKVAVENEQISFVLPQDWKSTDVLFLEESWIACNILPNIEKQELAITGILLSGSGENLAPQQMYANDLPLPQEDFLPFGEKFSAFDDFYICCNDVLTQAGANVVLTLEMDCLRTEEAITPAPIKWKRVLHESELRKPEHTTRRVERVLWEYWNGQGWRRLFPDTSYENVFCISEPSCIQIEFRCPEDAAPTWIGAEVGFWLRARIVSGQGVYAVATVYEAPLVRHIHFSYSYCGAERMVSEILEECTGTVKSYLCQQKQEISIVGAKTKGFPAAYLQLKAPLEKGSFKLFFRLEGNLTDNMPSLKWEAWSHVHGQKKWQELKVADDTAFFAKSGIVTLLCHHNMEQDQFFGQEGYWLRIVNMDGRYDTMSYENMELLPWISEIHFNTVPLVQVETLEPLYFYNMEETQHLQISLGLEKVYSLCVWVNEVETLVGQERLMQAHTQDDTARIQANEQGKITAYWVPWKQVQHLYDAGAQERVFVFDKHTSTLLFGDGIHGKIPPASNQEAVCVEVKTTNGAEGNFDAYRLEGFADAVPFVAKVYNTAPLLGGSDEESTLHAIVRNSRSLCHQNRAVSQEDFVFLARAADHNIIDVKVICEAGQTNAPVRIAVLPKQFLAEDDYFTTIAKKIYNQLLDKAPVVLIGNHKIDIFEVTYMEYSIAIQLEVADYQDYQNTYQAVSEKLESYLNPISGNFHHKGFSIGSLPTKMQIYNYLKNIKTISRIQSLTIFCYERKRGYRKEIDYDNIFQYPFAVPVNGIHEIDISVAVKQ